MGVLTPSAAAAETRTAPHRSRAKLFPPLRAATGALLALPRGFTYEVISEAGVTDLEDAAGTVIGKTPGRIDGSGVFATRKGYRLVQNHEVGAGGELPVPQVPGTTYDSGVTAGGCTVVSLDRRGRRRAEWVGLSGTLTNCAGGVTPWGSWLTCEESELRAGTVRGGQTLAEDHGYVFEVFPTKRPAEQVPEPIRAWGRYPHEAVVVAPGQKQVYLTEDAGAPNGLVYRWTAPAGYRVRPRLARDLDGDRGRLEALVVLAPDGSVLPDLAYVTSAQIGRPFRTDWVDVPDRQAASTPVRVQLKDGEVTRAKKLEGAWGDEGGFYFDSSFAYADADLPADATRHDGQLWYYDYEDETLTLKAYFPYNPLLHQETPGWEAALGQSLDLAFDGPDNVHVSPYGSLVLAEDGATANHLISWSETVGAQAIARNLLVLEQGDQGGNVYSELAGPTFTPDGKLLFANIQEPGHAFVIRGPWRRYLG